MMMGTGVRLICRDEELWGGISGPSDGALLGGEG